MHRREFLALPAALLAEGRADARRQIATPGGVVRGRVIDDRGKPLVACRVSIGSLIGSDVETRLLALPLSIRTDEHGMFEAHDVPPGDWYVRVEQDALPPSALASDTPDYPVTYFPGVAEARHAKAIHLTPGGLLSSVDVVVPAIPVFDMALKLSPLDALKAANMELFLNAAEAGRPRAITPREVEPDGVVRFRRLRAGRYFVWARARVGDRAWVAWRRVDIADRSQTLDFRLSPGGRLSGRVVGAEPSILIGARVVAVLVDDGREIDYREPDSAEIAADGRFAIDGVFAERQLRVIGLPEGWRVQSIRVAGRDVADAISVPEGGAIEDIEIALTR